MRFARPRAKSGADPILPLINVVFLLLIFFMLVAQITTPPPVRVNPPVAEAELLETQPDTLYLTADGTAHYGDLTGDAALAQVLDLPPEHPLSLTVDAALPARDLAGLLARIGQRPDLNLTVAR